MEVKILKCDVPNGNHRIYPTEVVKECIDEFNKLKQDDSLRNVYFQRVDNPLDLVNGVLGKVKKLKIKDDVLYADFEFGDNKFGKQCKEFYDECMNKGVSSSNFDYRIMMDCWGNSDYIADKGYSKVRDLEVHQFCFGLDSCWRDCKE